MSEFNYALILFLRYAGVACVPDDELPSRKKYVYHAADGTEVWITEYMSAVTRVDIPYMVPMDVVQTLHLSYAQMMQSTFDDICVLNVQHRLVVGRQWNTIIPPVEDGVPAPVRRR